MTHYDLLILGHVSKDIIVTPEGETSCIGGAVVYSSIAAQRAGSKVLALTKLSARDGAALDVFREHGVPVVSLDSTETTSIRNTYLTADRERRICEAISVANPFKRSDVPEDVCADVYYLGGLIKGEFPETLVGELAEVGKVALDAQGFLRVDDGEQMVFKDWIGKRDIIPRITYLKTDAAEAEILTGLTDRAEAARVLREWGAGEVMVTHNQGVLVRTADGVWEFPFTSRNLSGRTGRGDTCFSAYCAWRRDHSAEESCLFAAALTSLKMEVPGPFSGDVADVSRAIKERYSRT